MKILELICVHLEAEIEEGEETIKIMEEIEEENPLTEEVLTIDLQEELEEIHNQVEILIVVTKKEVQVEEERIEKVLLEEEIIHVVLPEIALVGGITIEEVTIIDKMEDEKSKDDEVDLAEGIELEHLDSCHSGKCSI